MGIQSSDDNGYGHVGLGFRVGVRARVMVRVMVRVGVMVSVRGYSECER